ncbi:MAG: hypothetical protein Q9209_005802 [Squamulea sp. 1 TL-2023]
MGLEDALKETDLKSHDPPHNAAQRLLKKKSLTRLFTTSRSSSRSRAPSIDENEVPSTPTIPEQYLATSRKASSCETPSAAGNGKVYPVQPTLADVTSLAGVSDEKPDTRNNNNRTSFKPKPKVAQIQGNSSDCEGAFSPTTHIETRSRKSSASYRQKKEKPTIQQASTFPRASKGYECSANGTNASSPRRTRGASAASPGVKDLQTSSHVPLRPSTSGGERNWTARDLETGTEEYQGLGLNLSLLPAPASLSIEEVRSSFRSAMTTASSLLEPSTTRSSVVTKESDTTIESPPRDLEEEGMTVDEAIGMYENGFMEDDSDHDIRNGSSVSEEERRRSVKIAEAINDTIGMHTVNSLLPATFAPLESVAVSRGTSSKLEHRSAPSILPPTTTRDQYGFLKGSRYVDVKQFNTWERVYSPDQFRRAKKWFTYMREQGCATHFPDQFPDRSPKTLRYIRKGIPPAWRGAAWFYYSGGARLLKENPRTYSSLLSRCKTSELSSNDVESIERDLHRTFPDNIHFKPDQSAAHGSETALLSSLRRLLQAFAIHRPQIGYCQSLNFLAGLLLLFLAEEKAFWMLDIITTDHLPGTHEISLEGANVDLWVLMLALKESNPSVWAKVGVGDEDAGSVQTTRLPPISLCTTSWFMSMFIGTLPVESVLRVWDVVFYEGSKMLFRTALAIFKMGEQRIKDVNDSMELFQVVQALPRGILDVGVLMTLACRRGGISQEWITKKRKERRTWYAKEKARVAGAMTPVDGGDSPIAFGSPNLNRANSAWKRRVKLVR